jgi:hypothetical protein
VGHGAHRARAVLARRGGRGERDPHRVADLAGRDRACARELGWCEQRRKVRGLSLSLFVFGFVVVVGFLIGVSRFLFGF